MLAFGEIRDELREGVNPLKLVLRLVRHGSDFKTAFARVYKAMQTIP